MARHEGDGITDVQAEYIDWLLTERGKPEAISQREWERQHNLNVGEVNRWRRRNKSFQRALNLAFADYNADPVKRQEVLDNLHRLATVGNDTKAASLWAQMTGAFVPTTRTETATEQLTDKELEQRIEDELALRRDRKGA